MIKIGKVYEVPYPFCRCKASVCNGEDGYNEIDSWKPGVSWEPCGPVADAMGLMILEVISIHKPGRFPDKPGRFPERVFYQRKWRNPSNEIFGKTKLRIATTSNFKKLVSGYRHEFRLIES